MFSQLNFPPLTIQQKVNLALQDPILGYKPENLSMVLDQPLYSRKL